MDVISFADVEAKMASSGKRSFSLLLGNGFSMAYDARVFSYNALHSFVEKLDNELLKALFRVVDTHDFEQVMRQLDTFAAVGEALGIDDALRARIDAARSDLKLSLINAVRSLHPEHVFTIPQHKCGACASFLGRFLQTGGSLFTTNYDLLLYWVLMRGELDNVDGFGRDRENPDEYVLEADLEWSELRWGRNATGQNVHYLHGALPLFDTGLEIVKEEYSDGYLLERITRRIEADEYPLFVTAGDGDQKLKHIRQNPYLLHSYEALSAASGSVVSFGFNFGPQDEHIISALAHAARRPKPNRLWSVYIGVFSDADIARATEIAPQLKCKVHLFDSKSAPVWGR